MNKNSLSISVFALGLVALLVFGRAALIKKPARRAPESAASARASSAAALSSALPAVQPMALGMTDPCAAVADRCACAAEHAAQLLAACFPVRALQVLELAPVSCTASSVVALHAEALAASERGTEAEVLATSVLKADPRNRFARRAIAIAALQNRDFAAADQALSALVAEDARDVDSLYYLALSQRRRDRYNGAREGFLRVLRLNAQHINARYNLVTLTAAAGAADEAQHDYEELLKITPQNDTRLLSAQQALQPASAPSAKAR